MRVLVVTSIKGLVSIVYNSFSIGNQKWIDNECNLKGRKHTAWLIILSIGVTSKVKTGLGFVEVGAWSTRVSLNAAIAERPLLAIGCQSSGKFGCVRLINLGIR